jgi:gamma-glutamyl:cysteine ligase YbdK (ATP-grasp superfamily)
MNHLEQKLDLREEGRHTLGFDVARDLEVALVTMYDLRFRQRLDVGEEDIVVVGLRSLHHHRDRAHSQWSVSRLILVHVPLILALAAGAHYR